jgi:hypothetical protein
MRMHYAGLLLALSRNEIFARWAAIAPIVSWPCADLFVGTGTKHSPEDTVEFRPPAGLGRAESHHERYTGDA